MVFYHIWAWWPSWSCDLDAVNKLSFPLTIEATHKIGFDWPSCFVDVEALWTTDGRRSMGIL